MLGVKIFELKSEEPQFQNLFNTGSAMQAVFLKQVHDKNPLLFEKLHSESKLRPYTVSVPFRIKDKICWKITSLNEQVSEFLENCLFEHIFLEKENIKFTPLLVKSEFISYKDFYGKFFLDKSTFKKHISLYFISPTSFKSLESKFYVPFPLPRLIFQSLINKWSSFASFVDVNDATIVDYIEKHIAITNYSLDTYKFLIDKGFITGFKGKCSIHIKSSDYFAKLVNMLIFYGYFSGIGIKTAMGMGQITLDKVNNFLFSTNSIFEEIGL
ncbi:MAG: CRISPR system precrRNA processing endoribonuclease RAMP protein Cas6 [bacterium]